MKYKVKILCLIIIAAVCLPLTACSSNQLKDGYYTAEMRDFSHGWKEYLCILVKNDTIIAAEYNAKDASGFIKSWDGGYMQEMREETGTYPNEYTRTYVSRLIANQGEGEIDGLTGATHSLTTFRKLAAAVVEQAKSGNTEKIIVDE